MTSTLIAVFHLTTKFNKLVLMFRSRPNVAQVLLFFFGGTSKQSYLLATMEALTLLNETQLMSNPNCNPNHKSLVKSVVDFSLWEINIFELACRCEINILLLLTEINIFSAYWLTWNQHLTVFEVKLRSLSVDVKSNFYSFWNEINIDWQVDVKSTFYCFLSEINLWAYTLT